MRAHSTSMRTALAALTGVAVLLMAAGCGSDDKESTASTAAKPSTTAAPTTAARSKTLRILVTNDDGIGAPGIDAIVTALAALPDTEVTVSAPAENQSATGGKTTGGTLDATPATTASGFDGTAVKGFPADSVIYAFDQQTPPVEVDLVVSGINQGGNIGPLISLSGTVGAARNAAQRGIPALAVSQGITDPPDYPSGVRYAVEWVQANRAAVLDKTLEPLVYNLNVPTCTTGVIRGQVSVPAATDAAGRELFKNDCVSTVTDFKDDVDAFGNGYVTLTELPAAA